jgi:hypothetical protein
MQLNAITRKSGLPSLLLLVATLVATMIRHSRSPFGVELATCAYGERGIILALAALIFFVGGIVMGKTTPRSGLINSYCTLAIPIYGVIAYGIFVTPDTLIAATASLCFALAIHLLLINLHRADDKDSVFFAAILLGLMVPLYPPAIVLVGVLPIAILTLALSARQIALMVIGYLLPLLATSYIFWYMGNGFWDAAINIFEALKVDHTAPIDHIPFLAIAMAATVVVILAWGGIYAVAHPDKIFRLARVRRSLHLFAWVTLLTLTMLFFPACDITILAIIAVPLGTLLAFALSILPNNPSTIAYWLLLLLYIVHLFAE